MSGEVGSWSGPRSVAGERMRENGRRTRSRRAAEKYGPSCWSRWWADDACRADCAVVGWRVGGGVTVFLYRDCSKARGSRGSLFITAGLAPGRRQWLRLWLIEAALTLSIGRIRALWGRARAATRCHLYHTQSSIFLLSSSPPRHNSTWSCARLANELKTAGCGAPMRSG